MPKNGKALLILVALLVVFSATASAQTPPPAATEPAPEQPMVVADPQPTQLAPVAERLDVPRFRSAFAFAGGGEFGDGVSGWLVGFDTRLGVQINDLIGVYLQPHLSFGKVDDHGNTGWTGNFAATAMADVTLLDRIFVGAGFGYGVLNNPKGPVLQIRAGGYPIMHFSDVDPRRRGLSLSFDLRMYFVGDPYGTITQVMVGIAYECY